MLATVFSVQFITQPALSICQKVKSVAHEQTQTIYQENVHVS